jgi:hypothetical protein
LTVKYFRYGYRMLNSNRGGGVKINMVLLKRPIERSFM